MKQHVASVRTNIVIFVLLLVLLLATVGAAYLPLGPLHFPIAMTIAAIKAVLIVLFFMHALAQPSADARHLRGVAALARDHDRADPERLLFAGMARNTGEMNVVYDDRRSPRSRVLDRELA